ncbi:MAG: hypothetical protein LBI96_07565 [Odoribacteraceae bacterium]|nr:hypothetical protein [Odoribacteraceae bacterium]
MKIEIFEGTDKRLYEQLVPLVMNPAVLRQNNNVAFKTSEKHTWILAIDGEECIGFLPVQRKKSCAEVNNYYIRGRAKKVFAELLARAESWAKSMDYTTIVVITQIEDRGVLGRRKYTASKEYVKYIKFAKEL